MTKGRAALPFRFDAAEDEQQVPPLRSPGFPVELGGADALQAPFPYRKAHTWLRPVQCGRKSGYAPVGMTLLVVEVCSVSGGRLCRFSLRKRRAGARGCPPGGCPG